MVDISGWMVDGGWLIHFPINTIHGALNTYHDQRGNQEDEIGEEDEASPGGQVILDSLVAVAKLDGPLINDRKGVCAEHVVG